MFCAAKSDELRQEREGWGRNDVQKRSSDELIEVPPHQTCWTTATYLLSTETGRERWTAARAEAGGAEVRARSGKKQRIG